MDCLPHRHLVGWSGNEWLFPTFAGLLWSCRSRMQGCKWNARGVIAGCVKSWKPRPTPPPPTPPFALIDCTPVVWCSSWAWIVLWRLVFVSCFISYTVMIGVFYTRVFVPLFCRTSFSVDGSDGEWDVDRALQRPSLSPSQWSFRLKTLPRGWYCGSLLHLHHRSVTDCKKNVLIIVPPEVNDIKGYINLPQIQCLKPSNSLNFICVNLK